MHAAASLDGDDGDADENEDDTDEAAGNVLVEQQLPS